MASTRGVPMRKAAATSFPVPAPTIATRFAPGRSLYGIS